MKDAPSKPYNCPVEVSACLVLLKNKKKNDGKKNLKATTKKQLSWLFNIFFTKKRKKNVGVDSGSTDKDRKNTRRFLALGGYGEMKTRNNY